MISCVKESECTGCAACQNKCPEKAITMIWNEKGFLQPSINELKCNSCSLCTQICPALNPATKKQILRLLGGYYADRNIVAKSSSGGAFYLLAAFIIANGGIVVGVVWDNEFLPCHIVSDNMADLEKMHGSKYVQSDKKEIYKLIQKNLKCGKNVLFTGTPCECLAVKRFLIKEYTNLFLVEFICHGIPAPGIWKDHLKSICDTERLKPTEVSFRSKERYGWHSFELKLSQEKQDLYLPIRKDLFFNGFIENLFLRECCYNCKCKDLHTESDISIADFWGSEIFSPKLDIENGLDGLSLIACFSEKGAELVDWACENRLFITETLESDEAYTTNSAAMYPAKRNKYTNKFYQYRKKHGTTSSLNKYAKYTLKKKIYNKITWKIRAILKK